MFKSLVQKFRVWKSNKNRLFTLINMKLSEISDKQTRHQMQTNEIIQEIKSLREEFEKLGRR